MCYWCSFYWTTIANPSTVRLKIFLNPSHLHHLANPSNHDPIGEMLNQNHPLAFHDARPYFNRLWPSHFDDDNVDQKFLTTKGGEENLTFESLRLLRLLWLNHHWPVVHLMKIKNLAHHWIKERDHYELW